MRKQLLYVALSVLVFGCILSPDTSNAQVTRKTFSFERPVVVNFGELAQFEKEHPVVLQPRFIEQGEDRDKFIFKPKPVLAGAKTQSISLPKSNAPAALTTSPSPTQNFAGVADNGTLIPPDINGAVGTTYAIETTNQQFNIYTKSTGALNSTVSITTLFSPSGLTGYYDPHVVYDPTSDRFIICIDAGSGTAAAPSYFGLAVSASGDPTGSWYIYKVECTPTATTDFMDYPMLGFSSNWIVMTGNDFPASGSNTTHIYVWPKATLYAGAAGTATTFVDATNILVSPASTYDAGVSTVYMVSDYNGNSGGNGYVNIGTITGTTTPVYTAGSQLGVNQPWQEPSALVDAPELGETKAKGLEAGDTRVHSCIYRNGSLWFTHSIFLPASGTITNAAVDWWQVNPSALSITQFGRITDAAAKIWYYYPSLDVNANGDMLIGYSTSSATAYGGAQYALRLASDAANTLETAVQYVNGVAGYYKTYGGGRNRWGDFSGTAFDPVDNSFWTFQEWANTGNNWGTQVAHIPSTGVATCNTPTGTTTSSITNNTATFGWAAVSGATGYNVQYRIVGTTTWSTGTATTNSYNATSLTAGSNYEWQVQTVCSATSTSTFTASTDFTTTGGCATTTGLTVSAITTSSATLGWSAVTGAVTYNLQWGASKTALTTVTGLTSNSYALSSLSAGTKYYFEVQTVCSGGSASYSALDSFTTTAPCTAPTGLSASSITGTSATLGWGTVSSAITYTLQWGTSTASFTTVTGLTTNSYPLSSLAASTKYYFQVLSVCASGSSGYSTLDSFTTSSNTITYCASKGTTTYEYIKTVALGSINHTVTNDGGYGNYTSVSTNLTAGTAYTIALTPGFTGSKYTEHFTVYIDYNQDGTLNGTGETVVTGTTSTTLSKSFTVPKTSKNGPTRIRIQMEYGATSTNPCATLTYGDVQDFTVNISGGTGAPAVSASDVPSAVEPEDLNTLMVVPNPASGSMATAHYNLAKDGNVVLKVIDLNGKVLHNTSLGIQTAGAHNYLLSNLRLRTGYYIIVLEQNNEIISRNRFIMNR
jgi:GEVED domain-containing protein/fibronectin type III domain protein